MLTDGYYGLSGKDNKVGDTSENNEAVSTLVPELELSMSDEDLLSLEKQWKNTWSGYEKEIVQIQKENEEYWLSKQFNPSGDTRPLVDNLLFEALETFLPIATRPKAEPLVEADNSEEGNLLADKVRKMLAYTSDRVSFNLKMKQVARYWALYMLGVMKVGWSMEENDITCLAIRPQKLILDPNSTIEESQYTGEYIGERVETTASDLVERFPKKKAFITEKVREKMGTKVEYIQWCTNEYTFYTFENEVLDKSRNPHWNYDSSEMQASFNEYGEEIEEEIHVPGKNHFKHPAMPYIFLSVYNLGIHPHDDTSLIHQNKSLQDLVNKRLSQIDKNADNANGGIAVSGDAFTEEQATKIAKARRKGSTLWIPSGDVGAAIKDIPAQPLPSFVYESLIDYRNEIRNIFGTRGSSAQGIMAEKTLGGKQIVKGQDTDRIGGGVSTYLEQFSDRVYNWFVQLMYVYYDEAHSATVLGAERAKEYIELRNSEFGQVSLTIGVKDGSMVPQDPMSKRNEAVELWGAKGIDPITFFERLEFPNPRESAKNLYLWNADPIQLFPDLLQQQQEQQQMEQEQQMAEQEQSQMAQMEQQQGMADQAQSNKLEQIEFANMMKQQQ